MSEKGQTTNEPTEVETTDTTNDSPVDDQNRETQTISDSDSTPEKDTGPTPSDQESLPSESATPDMDLLTEVSEDLSELLGKQNSGNQMLDDIQKNIKEFKENNLLEAKSVIGHLIPFYDNLVSVESQLETITKTFESLGPQLEDISEPLKSVVNWVESVLRKEQVEEKPSILDKLKGSTEQELNSCPELEDSLEKLKALDKSSLLFQAKTEIDKLFRFCRNLENARYEFEEALVRIDDVEPYKTDPLDKFNRKIHRAVDTRPTDDHNKHRMVAESHKVGFYRREDTVFRAEEVTMYQHISPQDESEGTGDQESTGADAPEETTNGNSTSEPETSVDEKSINEKGDETNE